MASRFIGGVVAESHHLVQVSATYVPTETAFHSVWG